MCCSCVCAYLCACVRVLSAKVLVTLTNKLGNILTRLHRVEPEGTVDFTVGIRVAHVRDMT